MKPSAPSRLQVNAAALFAPVFLGMSAVAALLLHNLYGAESSGRSTDTADLITEQLDVITGPHGSHLSLQYPAPLCADRPSARERLAIWLVRIARDPRVPNFTPDDFDGDRRFWRTAQLLNAAALQYQRAMDNQPDSGLLHFRRADCLNGEAGSLGCLEGLKSVLPVYNEAIAEYKKAAELSPSLRAYALAGIAHIYDKTGKAREATESQQKALKLRPGDLLLRLQLSKYFESDHQTKRAVQIARMALKGELPGPEADAKILDFRDYKLASNIPSHSLGYDCPGTGWAINPYSPAPYSFK